MRRMGGLRVLGDKVEFDADAWKLLRQTLRDVEDTEGAHLGRALAGPLASQLRDLTDGRYRNLHLNPLLKVEGVDVGAHETSGADVLTALSAGIRDQLATLIRVAIAEGSGSAIIVEDHLVHGDPERLGWFWQALMKAALKAQVIVLTCRTRDYPSEGEIPQAGAHLDLARGTIRAIVPSRSTAIDVPERRAFGHAAASCYEIERAWNACCHGRADDPAAPGAACRFLALPSSHAAGRAMGNGPARATIRTAAS